MSNITPLKYYGGKTQHRRWILPLLPAAETYVEPYAGSAAILLHREPAPVEVLNDIDGDLVTFFSVLREQPERLVNQLRRTPYAREAFEAAVEARDSDAAASDVERARRVFVRHNQARGGEGEPHKSSWSFCKTGSTSGRNASVRGWQRKIEVLFEAADRLRDVQIECRPAVDVIERYDHEDAVIYCDPPYVPGTRDRDNRDNYGAGEMTRDDHRELVETLVACTGRVAISGYPSELYERVLEDEYGWTRVERETVSNASEQKSERIEALWVNYEVNAEAMSVHQAALDDYGTEEVG